MTAPSDRVVLIAYDGSRQAKRAVAFVSTFIHEERVILLTAWQAVQMQAARASGIGGLVQPDWDSEKWSKIPASPTPATSPSKAPNWLKNTGWRILKATSWSTPPACGMPSARWQSSSTQTSL
ncbi:MAG: hypothetical protein U1U88_001606 [Lawsonella clevelandensis]